MTTNKIQKQNLSVILEDDKPVAILFRTKQGDWVLKGIIDLDEEGNTDLLDNLMKTDEKQNIKNLVKEEAR